METWTLPWGLTGGTGKARQSRECPPPLAHHTLAGTAAHLVLGPHEAEGETSQRAGEGSNHWCGSKPGGHCARSQVQEVFQERMSGYASQVLLLGQRTTDLSPEMPPPTMIGGTWAQKPGWSEFKRQRGGFRVCVYGTSFQNDFAARGAGSQRMKWGKVGCS